MKLQKINSNLLKVWLVLTVLLFGYAAYATYESCNPDYAVSLSAMFCAVPIFLYPTIWFYLSLVVGVMYNLAVLIMTPSQNLGEKVKLSIALIAVLLFLLSPFIFSLGYFN